MWLMRLLLLLCLSLSPALAQSPSRPSGYAEASQAFEQWTPDLRIKIQLALTAAGFWPAVPNEQFNGRVFKALQEFQSANGFAPTAILLPDQLEKLLDSSMPNFRAWDFKSIRHPERARSIWVPMGLGLIPEKNKYGLKYADPKQRFSLNFTYFEGITIEEAYKIESDIHVRKNNKIHFRVTRKDFYVISASEGDIDSYSRFHREGSGVIGVSIYWNNKNGNVFGERIATIVSGSLWASMTGARFTDIPARTAPKVDVADSEKPAQPMPPKVAIAPPPTEQPTAPKPPAPKSYSGTGFFVSSAGHVVTNEHVIKACSFILVQPDGQKPVIAQVIGRDASNDLALLKVDIPAPKVAALRIGVRLGEPVAAFGFPLADVLASSGNFTMGNVTALAGLGDDTRHVQTSTPVQPGNSGGPLLDYSGNLAGVITYKLNALKTALANGDIPQNVNFAVKSSILASFLESHRITPTIATGNAPLSAVDLAEHAKSLSTFILCK